MACRTKELLIAGCRSAAIDRIDALESGEAGVTRSWHVHRARPSGRTEKRLIVPDRKTPGSTDPGPSCTFPANRIITLEPAVAARQTGCRLLRRTALAARVLSGY